MLVGLVRDWELGLLLSVPTEYRVRIDTSTWVPSMAEGASGTLEACHARATCTVECKPLYGVEVSS